MKDINKKSFASDLVLVQAVDDWLEEKGHFPELGPGVEAKKEDTLISVNFEEIENRLKKHFHISKTELTYRFQSDILPKCSFNNLVDIKKEYNENWKTDETQFSVQDVYSSLSALRLTAKPDSEGKQDIFHIFALRSLRAKLEIEEEYRQGEIGRQNAMIENTKSAITVSKSSLIMASISCAALFFNLVYRWEETTELWHKLF